MPTASFNPVFIAPAASNAGAAADWLCSGRRNASARGYEQLIQRSKIATQTGPGLFSGHGLPLVL